MNNWPQGHSPVRCTQAKEPLCIEIKQHKINNIQKEISDKK